MGWIISNEFSVVIIAKVEREISVMNRYRCHRDGEGTSQTIVLDAKRLLILVRIKFNIEACKEIVIQSNTHASSKGGNGASQAAVGEIQSDSSCEAMYIRHKSSEKVGWDALGNHRRAKCVVG